MADVQNFWDALFRGDEVEMAEPKVGAFMGVDDQCRGRSTSPPGLVKRWVALVACPDQRTAILDGVVALILRHVVVEVKGEII